MKDSVPSLSKCREIYNQLNQSKSAFTYPNPKRGVETYAEYRQRVTTEVSKGFLLSSLSDDHWVMYCKGSGVYEGVDSDEKIA